LHLRRRLNKLELSERRRQEERLSALMPGEARRLLEEKLDAVRRRIQPAIDRGEYEELNVTVEQVRDMLYAHLSRAALSSS